MLNRVTTVTTAAESYDLTDLETVKDELGIEDSDDTNDAWLGRAISQISSAAANYCSRVFPVEAVTDVFYFDKSPLARQIPGTGDTLQLARWPVVAVSSVATLSGPDGETQTLTSGTDFILNAALGQLIRLNPRNGVTTQWKEAQVTVAYVAGYGAVTTESPTIPGGSPYQLTVEEAATFSIDQGVSYFGGAPLTLVASSPAEGQYSVDPEDGEYTFSSADAGKQVSIAYGYNDIPYDLVDAVLRMIIQRWSAKGRDPMLMERTQPGGVGTERYWIPQGQQGAFPPEITGILDQYRVSVIS